MLALSEKPKSMLTHLAFLYAETTCSSSRFWYRKQIESSSVSEVTVLNAPIDSDANFELSAKTSLFIFSNASSYLKRQYAETIIMGNTTQHETRASFHANANAMDIAPTTLKRATKTLAMFSPINSSSCLGSWPSRDVIVP